MDVSEELAALAANFSTAPAAESPLSHLILDPGLLAAQDDQPTPLDYTTSLESYLSARTSLTTTALLHSLFSLPVTSSPTGSGPTVHLPPALTSLPREKPLPAAKVLTKWERFANAKGISHVKKDKKVWDDEQQKWVNRWGRDGMNRGDEDAWIREVKGGEDADHDPILTSRNDRKARIAKNTGQRDRNLSARQVAPTTSGPSSSSSTSKSKFASSKSKSQSTSDDLPRGALTGIAQLPSTTTAPTSAKPTARYTAPTPSSEKQAKREVRKGELERELAVSRGSTASMGKFDKRLEGEGKVKGVKRKFEPTSAPTFDTEKSASMSIISSTTFGVKKPKNASSARPDANGRDGDINVRKAVRYQDRVDRLKNERSGGGTGGGLGPDKRLKGKGGKRR